MIIKVCGMREPRNIRETMALGIDWMGFIFYGGSPRCVKERSAAAAWLQDTEAVPHLHRTGVFVNAPTEEMLLTASSCKLALLQLHGSESPEVCLSLRKQGYRVIKAFPVSSAADLAETAAYADAADYFLFDTRCEGFGGSGKRFDWELLQGYQGTVPFLVGGGIHPGSMEALKGLHHPRLAGIDVNSGFETEPGVKDTAKLACFVRSIRTMNNG